MVEENLMKAPSWVPQDKRWSWSYNQWSWKIMDYSFTQKSKQENQEADGLAMGGVLSPLNLLGTFCTLEIFRTCCHFFLGLSVYLIGSCFFLSLVFSCNCCPLIFLNYIVFNFICTKTSRVEGFSLRKAE